MRLVGLIDLRRTAAILIGIDLLLVLAYVANVAAGRPSLVLHHITDLDAEATVAVWYTSAKLLLAGVLFLRAALPEEMPQVATRPFLVLVGVALVALSLDETAGLHEMVTVVLRRFASLPSFEGGHGMWIPFVLVGVVAFLLGTARSWLRLWARARSGTLLMGLGLALGLVGAVGLEIVSYEVVRPRGFGGLYVLQVATEEGLELVGASILLMGSWLVFRADADARSLASR